MRVRGTKLVRSGLNAIQSDIVDQIVKNLGVHLVCAVAGSGKTRLITYLIKALIDETSIRPQEILATTFTKKAAGEMNTRLAQLGVDIELARVGTFHSVCYEILRKDGAAYGGNFDIIEDIHTMVKEVTGYKGMNWNGCDITSVEQFIGLCKNALLRPDEVPVFSPSIGKNNSPSSNSRNIIAQSYKFVEAYSRFEELRNSRGKLTFDDMLIKTWELLSEVPNVLHQWQGRYKVVIVDEFQDTNKAQYEVMSMLAAPNDNIVVVGDDDQCQPPWTLVLTDNGYVKICDLSDGDSVKVWKNGDTSQLRKIKIADRYYRGPMYRIFVGRHFIDVTPKHKFIVKTDKRGIFETPTSNLVVGMMVPVVDGGWEEIRSIIISNYEGYVYSMDVEDEHNYIANEIVTKNSIYKWRGAVPEYMQEFIDQYNATVHRMEQNYRSYGSILSLSNELVRHNENRIKKINRAEREVGIQPTFTLCANMDDEAVTVADKVQELVGLGRKYGECCILYRTNAQSRAFEEEFIKRQIPHVVVGGTSFYNRKEVKDLLSYLQVVSDRDSSGEAAKRCANTPFRFLGTQTIDKATSLARTGNYRNLIEAIPDVDGIRSNQLSSVHTLLELLEELRQMVKEGYKPSAILEMVVKRTNFEEWIIREEGTDTAENSRISNIRELIRTSDRFSSVEMLLNYIDNLNRRRKRRTETPDTVLLMTGHKAKGLEFGIVFGVGWAEKILPHAKATDIEEERRLAYVIATRAKDELHLSAPEVAYTGGGRTSTLEPSRFLNEVIQFVNVVDKLQYMDQDENLL